MNTGEHRQDRPSDVDSAKRDVQRAERLLSNRLHEAGAAGEATLKQAFSVAKPVIVGVAAVAGFVWLVSLLRRPRRSSFLSLPSRPSVFREAARAAALSLASTAARRIGDHFLMAPDAAQSISPGRAGAPQPAPPRP